MKFTLYHECIKYINLSTKILTIGKYIYIYVFCTHVYSMYFIVKKTDGSFTEKIRVQSELQQTQPPPRLKDRARLLATLLEILIKID